MSERRFEFRGDLAEQPLPEILETVHRYRVPGVLTATSGGVEKKIYIVGGTVIFAASTDRNDSLGSFLRRRRRINTAEHVRGEQELLADGGSRRYGSVLVQLGLLNDVELHEAVTEQVKEILWSLFDWETGEVTFEVGQFRTDELIQLHIPALQAIADGIRRISDPKRCVGRLGPSWTVFEKGQPPPDAAELELSPAERQFLDRVDGLKTLRDLVALGPGDVALNARILYAFWVLKLILRRDMASGIKKLHWKTGSEGFLRED